MSTFRTEKYTMQEFRNLPRNEDGDLVSMYDHFLLLEPCHVELLTEDDWSRYWDYRDDMDYELQLARKEFSV